MTLRWLAFPAWRAGVQCLGILAVGCVALLGIRAALPLTLMWQIAYLLLTPGTLLWFALRWRLPTGKRWQVALAEVTAIVGWGYILAFLMLFMAGILQAGSATPALRLAQRDALIQGFVGTVLLLLALFRGGVRVWRWWDRLRRGSVSWALTHALLVAIAGVGLAFAALSVLLSLLFIPGYVLKVLPDAIFFLAVGPSR